MILLPPKGAGTVDRQERTCLPGGVLTDHYLAIITVSAPMFCAHRFANAGSKGGKAALE